jgi:hypothetical protein
METTAMIPPVPAPRVSVSVLRQDEPHAQNPLGDSDQATLRFSSSRQNKQSHRRMHRALWHPDDFTISVVRERKCRRHHLRMNVGIATFGCVSKCRRWA